MLGNVLGMLGNVVGTNFACLDFLCADKNHTSLTACVIHNFGKH